MARTMSVGSIRTGSGGTRQIPAEGTRLRKVYDIFKTHEGVPVEINLSNVDGEGPVFPGQLQDFYGLDLRCLIAGGGGGNVRRISVWVLAGEWFGMDYVDYIARHLKSESPSIVPAQDPPPALGRT